MSMKPYIVEETEDTPSVHFDAEKGIFQLVGKSLPEDPVVFYEPIHEWYSTYLKNPNSETNMVLELDYFNSASSKQIVELLMLMEPVAKNHNVYVTWRFHEDDELMELRGEELQSVLDVDFKFEKFS